MDNVVDETTDSGSVSIRVSVFLKWTKKLIEFEITIPTLPSNIDDNDGSFTKFTGKSFKDVVYSLTKVPVDRQKIVVAKSKTSKIKWWKGILKDDFDFSSTLIAQEDNVNAGEAKTIELRATLMGTAEVLASKEEHTQTVFIEDMTPAEKKAEELREMMDSMDKVAAMIPALQIPPQHRQPGNSSNNNEDENKESVDDAMMPIVSEFEETRAYDRLVHGFSQLRIDALLRRQQKKPQSQQPLVGRAVMTMGLELQRAYANDLTVLNQDGTLVSGMDDGHVQMWKHCQRIRDFIHQPVHNSFPGVDSVLTLDNNEQSSVSFATAGRGCIRFWDSEGDSLPLLVRSPLPYGSPTGLVKMPVKHPAGTKNLLCLASRFRIVFPPSRRPRLAPQDDEGRRRIAEIEATEERTNEEISQLSKTVQILFAEIGSDKDSNGNPTLQYKFLHMPHPVTALESWNDNGNVILAVGDNQGGIMLWRINASMDAAVGNSRNPSLSCTKLKYIRTTSLENTTQSRSSIVCMKYLSETKQLLVSTREIAPVSLSPLSIDALDVATTNLPLQLPQAVQSIKVDGILDGSQQHDTTVLFSLDGHKDVVHCLLPLPNGDLLTAGGKLDATTQIWSRSQLREAGEGKESVLTTAAVANLCKDAGYIFAAKVLQDFKGKGSSTGSSSSDSQVDQSPFAIAVARYNVVKIVI